MKTGDIVRYLNATGGGRVTRIEGKIAYVEEDGFETPVLIKDLVVVTPAGLPQSENGPRKMFDQNAYDLGRVSPKLEKEKSPNNPVIKEIPKQEIPIEETPHGEKLNITLAFEPGDVKKLSSTVFNAVLVNDSNYFLAFSFLRRGAEDRHWNLVFSDVAGPNELVDLAQYRHENLSEIERVAIQAIAFKKDKNFELKNPVNAVRKLNLTKFFKLHCFAPGMYFDSPVLEVPLVVDDVPAGSAPLPDPEKLAEAMTLPNVAIEKQLKNKYRTDKASHKTDKGRGDAANPNKLLPLIEVDLHIAALTDTTAGMSNADMLELQVNTVKKTMASHAKRLGQKIVFIHGKGEGVLRKAVLEFLKKNYPKAELQDASFREYGFGATLVTIH